MTRSPVEEAVVRDNAMPGEEKVASWMLGLGTKLEK